MHIRPAVLWCFGTLVLIFLNMVAIGTYCFLQLHPFLVCPHANETQLAEVICTDAQERPTTCWALTAPYYDAEGQYSCTRTTRYDTQHQAEVARDEEICYIAGRLGSPFVSCGTSGQQGWFDAGMALTIIGGFGAVALGVLAVAVLWRFQVEFQTQFPRLCCGLRWLCQWFDPPQASDKQAYPYGEVIDSGPPVPHATEAVEQEREAEMTPL